MGVELPRADELPESIVSLNQWLCWRTQKRNDKPTKIPVNPHTGSFGSATNPDSWASFDEARGYAIDGAAAGLGFVFTEDDPIVGVDLDDCRVPETGTLTGVAPDIVENLVSYTEVSPSGTGVHVLVEGTLPDDRNRRGNVEMYETARFFTVTGDHLDDTPRSIEQRHDELLEVHTEHVTQEGELSDDGTSETVVSDLDSRRNSEETRDGVDAGVKATEATGDSSGGEEETRSGATVDLSDTALLERARAAANGEKFARLWRGNTSGYESHSEADMALCALLAFWTGGDEEQIDRLFRDSGLMREKWDERHYADGSTYGEKTIERVLAGTDEFYEPNPEPEHTDSSKSVDDDGADPGTQATLLRLRRDRDDLESRVQEQLDLIGELRRQVERLEAENEQLRSNLDERRHSTDEDAAEDTDSPSILTRYWKWLIDDGPSR